MRKLPALGLALAATFFVSCGDARPPEGDGDPPGPSVPAVDAAGLWELRSGRAPSGEIETAPDSPITMEIDGDEIRGSAGCNSYGAGVTIEGDAFTAGGLVLTEIGCPPDVAESERRFIEAVDAAETIARRRRTLTLSGPGTELVFRLVPPIDPKPLTGTVWILETLLEGGTASSRLAPAGRARLLLEADGTFEGTTGCRAFSGAWEISGDVVAVTQMVFRGECRRAAEQDAHVAAVIGTGFRAEREGDRLTLISDKGDVGLVYRSR